MMDTNVDIDHNLEPNQSKRDRVRTQGNLNTMYSSDDYEGAAAVNPLITENQEAGDYQSTQQEA